MKIMGPDRIEALNRRVCEIAGLDYEDMDATNSRYAPLDGIQQVLIEEDLAFVRHARTSEGLRCEFYRDPRTGEVVNLRVNADTLSFDDQVAEPALPH